MYNKFYELFNESFTNTVIGQGLDLITPYKIKDSELFDFTNYDQDHYDQIVKWKTAFYSFCLPVQNALYLAFIDEQEVHEKCREILLEMGNYFQIQVIYKTFGNNFFCFFIVKFCFQFKGRLSRLLWRSECDRKSWN
jgi:farnesyl diphosphate synthase